MANKLALARLAHPTPAKKKAAVILRRLMCCPKPIETGAGSFSCPPSLVPELFSFLCKAKKRPLLANQLFVGGGCLLTVVAMDGAPQHDNLRGLLTDTFLSDWHTKLQKLEPLLEHLPQCAEVDAMRQELHDMLATERNSLYRPQPFPQVKSCELRLLLLMYFGRGSDFAAAATEMSIKLCLNFQMLLDLDEVIQRQKRIAVGGRYAADFTLPEEDELSRLPPPPMEQEWDMVTGMLLQKKAMAAAAPTSQGGGQRRARSNEEDDEQDKAEKEEEERRAKNAEEEEEGDPEEEEATGSSSKQRNVVSQKKAKVKKTSGVRKSGKNKSKASKPARDAPWTEEETREKVERAAFNVTRATTLLTSEIPKSGLASIQMDVLVTEIDVEAAMAEVHVEDEAGAIKLLQNALLQVAKNARSDRLQDEAYEKGTLKLIIGTSITQALFSTCTYYTEVHAYCVNVKERLQENLPDVYDRLCEKVGGGHNFLSWGRVNVHAEVGNFFRQHHKFVYQDEFRLISHFEQKCYLWGNVLPFYKWLDQALPSSHFFINTFDLHHDGFCIIQNAIEISDMLVQHVRDIAGEGGENCHVIFNNGPVLPQDGMLRNDGRRRQLPFTEQHLQVPVLQSFFEQLRLVGCKILVSETVQMRQPTLLYSARHCKKQMDHQDVSLNQVANGKHCFRIIVSLEKGTLFNYYIASHGEVDEGTRCQGAEIDLDRGDAILFRADGFHSGAATKSENIRLFAGFDHPEVVYDQPENTHYDPGQVQLLPLSRHGK